MRSWPKLLRVLLVCGMIPLTVWITFPHFACACPISAAKSACTCGSHKDGEETSCCQESSCCAVAKEDASVGQRYDDGPVAALVAKGVSLPGPRLCQCTSAPSQQAADSATRQAETERFVLHLILPAIISVREADQHVAVRFSGAALPGLDRVILFCTLLI